VVRFSAAAKDFVSKATQTECGTHAGSYSLATGDFPGGEEAGTWNLPLSSSITEVTNV